MIAIVTVFKKTALVISVVSSNPGAYTLKMIRFWCNRYLILSD